MNPLARATLLSLALSLAAAPAGAVATRTLIAPSATASQFLGQSVSDAGDVNGDGYPDVIVGAPLYNGAVGRAYVYFGGPDVDEVADWTLTGPSPSSFGASVAGAGDVNGDGYDDVIVGAPNFDGFNDGTFFIYRGAAYVFFGGPAPDAVADVTMEGVVAPDAFGSSVAGAGDVNGDGFDDFIIGATQGYPTGGGGEGEAYIYFGGPVLDNVADVTLSGEIDADEFGRAVGGGGDVNGDGFNDVIVGATGYDNVGFNSGAAYVFFGGPGMDAVADVTYYGATSGDLVGAAVLCDTDFNLDGYDDVIVGAPNSGTTFTGEVFVLYGGASPDNAVDLTFVGAASSDLFGGSVSGAGDLNGDFFPDIVVGAELNDVIGGGAGRAYVFFGGSSPDLVSDVIFDAETADDRFGVSVSGAGDMTGDGFPDIIVGAERNDAGGSNSGRAYVFDFSRFFVTAPNGGETWPVGSTQSITWDGDDEADLWLSVDGGLTFEKLREGAGGSAENAVPILVPHAPTRFAVVRVTKTFQVGAYAAQATNLAKGDDQSDAFFTIESSVSLLTFTVAARPGGGVELEWASEPAVGPQGIAGYRLYRDERQIGPSLMTATRFVDADGAGGSTYRLSAVNGLGHEIVLGSEALARNTPLAAWPMPFEGGVMSVRFAAGNAFGGGAGEVDVSLYDAAGRHIRTLESGVFAPGFHTTTWDGRDRAGRRVPGGIYFLNLRVGVESRQMKVVVAP